LYRFTLFVFSLLLLILVCACEIGKYEYSDPERISIVTTIYPLYDIISELGGEQVNITYLLPPGASPHTYELTTEQARLVSNAELFVYIGAELDQWAVKMAGNSDSGQTVLDLSREVPLLSREINGNSAHDPSEDMDHETEVDEGHHHNHGPVDPHYWLDPVIVRDHVAPAITAVLISLSPADELYFREKLAYYQEELDTLDREIAESLADYSVKRFITFHSAWYYFAERYNLDEVAVIARFPGQEPSAGWMAELVKLVDEKKIKVILAEPQFSSAMAEQIAVESGIKVLLLDPIGGEDLEGRKTYLEMMRYNLDIFRQGFSE